MDIVEEPHLGTLRNAVSKLKTLVDGDPGEMAAKHAWACVDKIQESLSQLYPNHPDILRHK